MMISQKICEALNKQITNEFFSAQVYLAMACYFDGKALKMLAKHFRRQTEEEREHAYKIMDYILEQGGQVTLEALDAPQNDYPSVVAALEAAVEHEKLVTRQINELADLAAKENDRATLHMLGWFVEEQVEEVSSMQHLLDIARMCGNALLQLEAYMIHHGSNS